MLKKEQKDEIEKTIIASIRQKLIKYNPESKHMPFHYRLLGKDRMYLFSFIHSLNTTFGTSLFEPIAEIIAKGRFKRVEKQFSLGSEISNKAQSEIQHIINQLSSGTNTDKPKETSQILKSIDMGSTDKIKAVKADIFLDDFDGNVHMFDIKTAKPNLSNFKDFKRTLLEWIAIYKGQNQDSGNIFTYIGIPYNPYHPKPYERWTMKGMLDIENELKVAEEFWDFLGGIGAYDDVLECFEVAGKTLRPEIDSYFKKFEENH